MPKSLYQHLIAPAYAEGLEARPPAELRDKRAECEQMEAAISFARRALHGRLDIVHAELQRRAAGRADRRLDDLVEQLPEILAESQPVGVAHSPRVLVAVGPEPSGVQEELMAAVDAVVGPVALTSLPELDDDALAATAAALAELEAELSGARRQLHQQIDALQAELTARYERGELSVESLLT